MRELFTHIVSRFSHIVQAHTPPVPQESRVRVCVPRPLFHTTARRSTPPSVIPRVPTSPGPAASGRSVGEEGKERELGDGVPKLSPKLLLSGIKPIKFTYYSTATAPVLRGYQSQIRHLPRNHSAAKPTQRPAEVAVMATTLLLAICGTR